MTGSVLTHPEGTPEDPSRWTFRFKNDTGDKICDFFLSTNFTGGNVPELKSLIVRSPDGATTYTNTTWADEPNKGHVKLDTCIPKGEEFKMVLECNDYFEEDERLEISPTDSDGGVISSGKPAPMPEETDPLKVLLEILKQLLPLIPWDKLFAALVREQAERALGERSGGASAHG